MSGAGESDDELLRRHSAGDGDAFVAFYRRHFPAMVAFFMRRVGDAELTADLTAEVFAAALLAAPRLRPGELPARAWLYAIATVCSSALRMSRRRSCRRSLVTPGSNRSDRWVPGGPK